MNNNVTRDTHLGDKGKYF